MNYRPILYLIMLVLLSVRLTGCDLNDPDEVQNSSNLAIVRAQFFESRSNRVPIPGVRLLVEAPPPELTDRPYNGPDVIAVSGEDGIAQVGIFPGLTEIEGGGGEGGEGGGGSTAGPTSPLEVPAPLYFADVAVVFIYQGQIVSFISTGLTVGSGRLYDLGAIYLDEFRVVTD